MNKQLVDLTENWGTSVVKLNIQCEREPACSFIAGGGGGWGEGRNFFNIVLGRIQLNTSWYHINSWGRK